jgi:hypothetical protein
LGRGGARRTKVPEYDVQHLSDSLEKWTRHMGAQAFKFGKYDAIKKTGGVDGTSLSELLELVELLVGVSEQVIFKYSDLKGVVTMLLQKYQVASQSFKLEQLGGLPGDIANAIMTICSHARRLKKKEVYMAAIAKCTSHQANRLLQMRNLLGDERHDMDTLDDQHVPNTQDVLDLEVPLTPNDEHEEQDEEDEDDEQDQDEDEDVEDETENTHEMEESDKGTSQDSPSDASFENPSCSSKEGKCEDTHDEKASRRGFQRTNEETINKGIG